MALRTGFEERDGDFLFCAGKGESEMEVWLHGVESLW